MSQQDIRLAIYQPDIPQNLGAMIRLCACFGVEIDLIEPCGFPFSIKSLRRTAMDYTNLVKIKNHNDFDSCLLYTSPSPRDVEESRMPSSA